MVSAVNLRFNASDRSYFAIIKKEIHAVAVKAGFTAKRTGEIDIIISEMVSNLSKHAVDGELLVKLIEEEGIQGMEIIAIDNGPGINDVPRMMADGISTTNTLGHGLGAIQRLSDKFQVYSRKDWGTILYSTVYNEVLPSFTKPRKIEVRSLIVPKTGETDCGDGFYTKVSKDHVKLFLGDGLGHGKGAQAAVQEAIEAFRICPEDTPRETLRFIHSAVKKTRGLVGTVVIFDIKERKWSICGIGNIFTRLQGASVSKNYVAHNGIIGLNIPHTMRDEVVDYERGQNLIMCSDGIKTRWDLLRYPGILRCDLAFVGAALFKDFARDTDDMAIAACKINV